MFTDEEMGFLDKMVFPFTESVSFGPRSFEIVIMVHGEEAMVKGLEERYRAKGEREKGG